MNFIIFIAVYSMRGNEDCVELYEKLTLPETIETFRSDNGYDYDYEIRTWEAGTRL